MKRAIVLGLAALIACGAASAETRENGLPAAGSIIALRPTAKGYLARIAVSSESHYTNVVAVSNDPAVKAALRVAPVKSSLPAPNGKPWIHEVDVEIAAPNLAQAQYDLTLTATPDKGNPIERSLWMQVAAAAIEPPSTLVIARRDWWPLKWTVEATSPQIWESTRRAWLTGVTLTQRGDTEAGGEPAGRVTFTNKALTIPPGGSARLDFGHDFSLAGDFPLGVAKGTILVQADQFASPVPLAFEVHSSVATAYLFGPLALGLALGFAARKGLRAIITANQKRQDTFALITQIDKARLENKDRKFQADTAAAREAAVAASKQDDATTIETQTNHARDQFVAASDDLAQRRKTLQLKVAGFKALVSLDWDVPEKMHDALQQVASAVPVIDSASDVESTDDAVVRLMNQLRTMTEGQSAALRAGAANLAAIAKSLKALAGDGAEAQFQGEVTASVSALKLAEPAGPAVTVDGLNMMLAALHTNRGRIREAVQAFARAVEEELQRWNVRLNGRPLADPQRWKTAGESAKDYARRLFAVADNPDGTSDELRDDAATVAGTIQNALAAQIPAGTEQATIDACNAGKLSETVDWLVAHVAAAAPAGGLESRDDWGVSTPPASETQVLEKGGAPVPSLPTFKLVEAMPVQLPEVEWQRAKWKATLGNVMTYLIYALVILVAGYFLFAAKWIGAPIDFASAFFWAFAIDVGADAATSAIQSFGRK